jgi:hypothetical protein
MKMLCHKVKMRTTEFTSFSVLALFLIFAMGILIMSANGFIPYFVKMWQQRTGQGDYKRWEWIEINFFQLYRMAAEGRRIGPWDRKDADVPILAEKGVKFNLTQESLRGGGEVDGRYAYQGVARGERSPQPDGFELVEYDAKESGRAKEHQFL